MQSPQTPSVSDAAASKCMASHMEKMASPTPSDLWVVPREFPVDSCPINYEASININSAAGSGVVIDCKPDLQEAVTIYSEKPNSTITVTALAVKSKSGALPAGALTSFRWCPELIFYDVANNEVPVASWLSPDPLYQAWDEGSNSWVPGHVRLYAAQPSALGQENCVFTAATGATTFSCTLGVATYNLALQQTSADTQTTVVAQGILFANVVGGITTTDPLFTAWVQLPGGLLVNDLNLTFSTGAITLAEIQKTAFNPAPALNGSLYDTVVETSSKYSFPILDVLGTFTGSDLLNGGNLAVGIVPFDFPLSRIPAVAYEQISALGGRRYTGPMKKGFHGFYIPDDVTRIAFLEMDEKVKGRRIVCAILPQTLDGGNSSSVSIRLRVRSHIEFINAAQTLAHMTSVHGLEEEFHTLFAALGSADTQVGENPDHVRRMKDAIVKAAKDPRVIEAGKHVLSALGKVATIGIPLMFAGAL